MTANITVVEDMVYVHDPDKKDTAYEWSMDMWETSVLQPIESGMLPHSARNASDPPESLRQVQLLEWSGGDVVWAGVEFEAAWWTSFMDQIHDGTWKEAT